VAEIVGPYTRHNAPAVLLDFLRSLNDDLEPRTPVVWAGEDSAVLDTYDYIEGEAVDGTEDQIVVV
jgi:hypothetical protein